MTPFKNFEDTNRQFLFGDCPQNDWKDHLEKPRIRAVNLTKNERSGGED
jgi:hypothetical protein